MTHCCRFCRLRVSSRSWRRPWIATGCGWRWRAAKGPPKKGSLEALSELRDRGRGSFRRRVRRRQAPLLDLEGVVAEEHQRRLHRVPHDRGRQGQPSPVRVLPHRLRPEVCVGTGTTGVTAAHRSLCRFASRWTRQADAQGVVRAIRIVLPPGSVSIPQKRLREGNVEWLAEPAHGTAVTVGVFLAPPTWKATGQPVGYYDLGNGSRVWVRHSCAAWTSPKPSTFGRRIRKSCG